MTKVIAVEALYWDSLIVDNIHKLVLYTVWKPI